MGGICWKKNGFNGKESGIWEEQGLCEEKRLEQALHGFRTEFLPGLA